MQLSDRTARRHECCIAQRMTLANKVVVVTGGTAGVGYAAATEFARQGARVVVLGRDPERVERTAAALPPHGVGMVANVSDPRAVETAAERIERDVGPIEVWVNNAMTTVFGRFVDMTPAEFTKVTANTYLGAVYGTFAALKRMRPRNRGVVIQVGSALAYQAIPLQSAYCGAKHGIRGFTNALRAELIAERSGVAVSMVQLSAFNTPQFEWARSLLRGQPRPLGAVFAPALAAEAIVRAAQRPRRELWVGWPAVQTIWASRLVPAVAERLAAKMAITGQQRLDDPVGPHAGNLYDPVHREPGAEGAFTAQERHASLQWTLSKHRRPLLGALAMAAVAGAAVLAVRRAKPRRTGRLENRSGLLARFL
jgi:NAD(P)-dependent dehydrogenase (short-subunit alcohol dehydrogenase family)